MSTEKRVTGKTARVALLNCLRYEPDKVYACVNRAVEELGGIDRYIRGGDRVLLKPNLLIGRPADKHVTTHPEIVRAVIKLAKKAGGKPVIGDSPAIGSAGRVAGKCGIADVAKSENVEIVDFNRPVDAPNPSHSRFKKFIVDQSILDADVVISLPKLKSHGQMTLTLGVKNLFGAVPGTRKSQWHLAAGTDRMNFARMLVDLYRLVSPQLTIMDGIVGMHGNGPQNGDLKKIGVITVSEDAVALDAVVCEIVGLRRDRMPTIMAAEEMGVGQARLGNISVAGEELENCRVGGFIFPKASDLMGMFPPFLRHYARDWLTTRPVLDPGKCELCGVCVNNCPAHVITEHGDSLNFDLKQCIRCFCCQEMCPQGAISVGSGPLAKLLRM